MNLNGASLLYPCHTPQWPSVSRLKAIVLVAGGRGWARAADFRQNYACSSRELRKLWKAPASRRNAAAMPHTTLWCHQSLRFLAAANWVRVRAVGSHRLLYSKRPSYSIQMESWERMWSAAIDHHAAMYAEKNPTLMLAHCVLDTIQDFLFKLGMKARMHLVEISIFSLNHVIVRPTKIIKDLCKAST